MYRWIGVGFCLLIAHFSFASTLAELKQKKILKAATEGTFPPFNFYQGDKLTGFEVELLEEISKDLGLKIEWKVQSFDTLLIGLQQNRFDIVASSHAITDERSKVSDFSNPHYCTGGVIVSRSEKIKSLEDLKNRNVVVQVGTSYYKWLSQNGISKAKTYPKDTDALQNLLMGRADAWVTDKFVALEAMRAYPAAKLILGDQIFKEQIGMALKKGNTELVSKINQSLKNLKQNGYYKKLSLRYFGQDIRCD